LNSLKKITLVLLLIVIVFLSYSFLSRHSVIYSTERFVESFYNQYNHKDFQYIYDILSDPKMRSHMGPVVFAFRMQSSYDQLGPVQSRKRTMWKKTRTPEGTFFLVQYKVKRTHYTSTEKFVLIQKKKDWFVDSYEIRRA